MFLLHAVLLFVVRSVFGGNILVLNPLHGHSHVRLLGNLADLLASDGHNVTVLAAVMDPTTPPYKHKNPSIRQIIYKSPYLPYNVLETMEIKSDVFWKMPESDGMALSWSDFEHFMGAFRGIYRGLLEDKELMKSLKDSQFDLGVAEIFDLASVGLLEILNTKAIMVAASTGLLPLHYEITGIPYFPSFIPGVITTYGEKMSFWERLNNLKANFEYQMQVQKDSSVFNELFREFHPEIPDLYEIAKKKTGVILSNSNEFTESPRLRSNLVQYIGGTNVHPIKPLEKEISDILNLRPKNVFFSFGTFANVCHMPLQKKIEILEAFAEFPDVTFLWKHEKCEGDQTPIGNYPNVVRKGWWPQSDILGDPRLNAFITHAGMNSFTEAVFRGIPTITVPLFGDQYINAKASESRGLSVMVKRTELNKENLISALKEVLNDSSPVVRNAKMAGVVMNGKDEEYRTAVLKWANLLIEYGPQEHLFLPSRNLNFFQLYSLDILGFLLFVVSVALFVVVRIYKSFRLSIKLKKL